MKKILILLLIPVWAWGQESTIGNLTKTTSLSNADVFVVEQTDSTRKVRYDTLKNAILNSATMNLNTINEYSSEAGVTIDGLKIKDNAVGTSSSYADGSYFKAFYIKSTGSSSPSRIFTSNDYLWLTAGGSGNIYLGDHVGPNEPSTLLLGYPYKYRGIYVDTVFLSSYSYIHKTGNGGNEVLYLTDVTTGTKSLADLSASEDSVFYSLRLISSDTIASPEAGEFYFDSDGWLYFYDGVNYDTLNKTGSGGGGSSYTFSQSLNESAGTVTLDNDSNTPGNYYFYGTNGSGAKGWVTLTDAAIPNTITASSYLLLTDTALMLTNYPVAGEYIAPGDTAAMLDGYLLKSDTAVMLANFQEIDAQLTDLKDGSFDTNFVNTAYPWADNEVADNITASSYLLLTDTASMLSNYPVTGEYIAPGDNATELDGTAHRLFYTDGSGNVTELSFGTDGQVLTSTGAASAPAFEDATGSTDTTGLSQRITEDSTRISALEAWQADTINIGEVVRLMADTCLLFCWDIDSALFQTSTQVAKFYHYGPDTLYITQTRVGTEDDAADFSFNLQWATSQSGSPTTLFTVSAPVDGTEIDEAGEVDTSFDNPSIPPGVWVWLTTESITARPSGSASFNFIGYEY